MRRPKPIREPEVLVTRRRGRDAVRAELQRGREPATAGAHVGDEPELRTSRGEHVGD